MPVRSLNSSVLIWPDRAAVDQAVRLWGRRIIFSRPEVTRVGYFGSYARGNWGVGSDLDLVIVVARSEEPFARRAAGWDATDLPVPADVLVYTAAEWNSLAERSGWGKTLSREVVWVYQG